jgi:hypothetical protein
MCETLGYIPSTTTKKQKQKPISTQPIKVAGMKIWQYQIPIIMQKN